MFCQQFSQQTNSFCCGPVMERLILSFWAKATDCGSRSPLEKTHTNVALIGKLCFKCKLQNGVHSCSKNISYNFNVESLKLYQ